MVFMELGLKSLLIVANAFVIGTGGLPGCWLLLAVVRTRLAEWERSWVELLAVLLFVLVRSAFLVLIRSLVEFALSDFFFRVPFSDLLEVFDLDLSFFFLSFSFGSLDLDLETDLDFSLLENRLALAGFPSFSSE